MACTWKSTRVARGMPAPLTREQSPLRPTTQASRQVMLPRAVYS
jgi:hypothetical protein